MNKESIWIGDKLPSIYDASIRLKYLAPTPKGSTRSSAVYRYSEALQEVWEKSFTSSHVASFSTIFRTVQRIIDEYDKFLHKHVYGKGNITKKSVRVANKEWRLYCNTNQQSLLPKGQKGRPSKKRKIEERSGIDDKRDALLNIGVDMNCLSGKELSFYEDQCGPRLQYLSEEVDVEFEEERASAAADLSMQIEEEEMNESFANPIELLEVTTPTASRDERYFSRKSKPITEDKSIQTSEFQPTLDGGFPRPEIRNIRNFYQSVKDAITTVSIRCAISIPKARMAYQAVMEKRYGHRYYLSSDEQRKFEPVLESISEEEPQLPKQIRRKEDYSIYRYVLPSKKVIGCYKHDKSLHQEIVAGKALGELDPGTRVTLHFDTTSRSRIDGEWPALILNFLNKDKIKCKMIRLRALFFAYEDREQITKLIVETLNRLSVATAGEFSPKILWENIYAYMTDSVSKNLKVEYAVAEILGSSHIPIHILCKSHTCEKLDEACLSALVEVESAIKFADLITKRQPQLKSFVRQSKCVVFAALKAMLQLVSQESSAKPTSLADEFDLELEKNGLSKSMSLYKERRFTKLGYSAGAVFDCLEQYKNILRDTTCSNLLIQACQLYVENEFVVAAFKALGYFTFKVTMPYLNCVEICDQNSLLPILKQLHDDLKEGKLNTLDDYSVPWTHVNTDNLKPATPLDYALLDKMSKEAAIGVHLQCSREYWEENDEKSRATQLNKLTAEQRECIPTENMSCERYLARFGGLASVAAAKSNRFFKAKRIRDDLMFETKMSSEKDIDVDKATKRIIKQLNAMELDWTESQKKRLKAKIAARVQKRVRKSQYKEILLKTCKKHNGPTTCSDDVRDLLNRVDDDQLKSCLRAEIGFQKALHPFDARERPHLYKMNFLSAEELTENLLILFDEYDTSAGDESVSFPTEDEIFRIISMDAPVTDCSKEDDKKSLKPNEPVAVIWDEETGERNWWVGFYVCDIDEDTIKVDHLTRQKKSNRCWIRAKSEDVQPVNLIQVVPVDIAGDWDFRNERCPVFNLRNDKVIQAVFNEYLST